MVPVVGVDRAPTTAFVTEACALSPGPPISVPVSRSIDSIPVLKQLSDGGLEFSPTVSDDAVLRIIVTKYWYSTRLRSPIVHYRLRCLMPQCRYLRDQNKISL